MAEMGEHWRGEERSMTDVSRKTTVITFFGTNRRGVAITGVAQDGESAYGLAKRLHARRVRSARIMRGEQQVGGIDDGVWWGER